MKQGILINFDRKITEYVMIKKGWDTAVNHILYNDEEYIDIENYKKIGNIYSGILW